MTTKRVACGDLRAKNAGDTVTVYGWVDRRRDHGGLIFLDIRDRSGIIQVVVNPTTAAETADTLQDVRLEWVLKIDGKLSKRATENINPNLGTGEVEVQAHRCQILSKAQTPPFPINEDINVDEKLRLKYRYLDLRHSQLQENLRRRAQFVMGLREALIELGFTEIETPMMVRATPEGARDYIVPSRIFPGSFYALPQSPQIYKQICMVAGIDRYYQIARCMRDEDLRADRQPEFTQLDLEMSFVDEEDIFAATEYAISHAWGKAEFIGSVTPPWPRITYAESVCRYGVDKPDTRFGMELQDITDQVSACSFKVFSEVVAKGGVVKAIVVVGGDDLKRTEIETELTDVIKIAKAKGLAYLWLRADGWEGSIAKFFTAEELGAIKRQTKAQIGDALLMIADQPQIVAAALGALRNYLGGKRQLYDRQQTNILWVTEFPMFERSLETGVITPSHHPFTMVHDDDLPLLETNPLGVRSRAYDAVIDGREIGSGSIRITDPTIQRRVFAALGLTEQQIETKFGFMLEAFSYGVPPHGGFAPGIERLVMEGLGTDNIRDVIAFPKTQQAQELMTNAPASIEPEQLKEVGLKLDLQEPKFSKIP